MPKLTIPDLTFYDETQVREIAAQPSQIFQDEAPMWKAFEKQWEAKISGRREVVEEWNHRRNTPQERFKIHRWPSSESCFISLRTCIAKIIADASDTCKPFFTSAGLIGHTEGDIKEGDFICAFRGSAVVLAIRCINNIYRVSGIGWDTFHELGTETPEAGRVDLYENSTIDSPVHFGVGLQALMAISADWTPRDGLGCSESPWIIPPLKWKPESPNELNTRI
jgi:hypothetical protein